MIISYILKKWNNTSKMELYYSKKRKYFWILFHEINLFMDFTRVAVESHVRDGYKKREKESERRKKKDEKMKLLVNNIHLMQ